MFPSLGSIHSITVISILLGGWKLMANRYIPNRDLSLDNNFILSIHAVDLDVTDLLDKSMH